MQSVLCFGDSLTWGARPDGQGRHSFEHRWPNVLAAGLKDVEVITEGLRGRLTCFDQPTSPAEMNGGAMLDSLLHSHAPLDLVIILLGTNDSYWGLPAAHAGKGAQRLIEIVRHHPWRQDGYQAPKALLIAPPVIVPCEASGITAEMINNSTHLPEIYQQVAIEEGCGFFDANAVAQSSDLDGFHLDAPNTQAIGQALVPIVTQMLRP